MTTRSTELPTVSPPSSESWWGWFSRNLIRVGDGLVNMIPEGNIKRRAKNFISFIRRKASLVLSCTPRVGGEVFFEHFIVEVFLKRFLVEVPLGILLEEIEGIREEEKEDFYLYFITEEGKKLDEEEEALFLRTWMRAGVGEYFEYFMEVGKEDFFEIFLKLGGELSEEQEKEEFFKHFVGVGLEEFFRKEELDFVEDYLMRRRISNWLITEIISRVRERKKVRHTSPTFS